MGDPTRMLEVHDTRHLDTVNALVTGLRQTVQGIKNAAEIVFQEVHGHNKGTGNRLVLVLPDTPRLHVWVVDERSTQKGIRQLDGLIQRLGADSVVVVVEWRQKAPNPTAQTEVMQHLDRLASTYSDLVIIHGLAESYQTLADLLQKPIAA